MKLLSAVFFCGYLTLSACSSTVKLTSIKDLPDLSGTAEGDLFSAYVETEHPVVATDGCTLIIRESQSFKDFEIKLQPGHQAVFAELPPGTYVFNYLYCSSKNWNLRIKHWAEFQVYPGKISATAGIYIYIDENFRATTDLRNRQHTHDELQPFFGRLAVENQKRVVSGYTGKEVDPKVIEAQNPALKWDILDTKGNSIKNDKSVWPTFHSCYAAEDEVNRLWLGVLELDATFDGGKWIETKVGDDWNSFSDHFMSCAKNRLSEFEPVVKEKIVYKVRL